MKEKRLQVGCVVMAAGNARRFGDNKLVARTGGKSLIQRALEAVPAEQFCRVVVVTQYPEVERLAKAYGFAPVYNPHSDWGISYTIRLGLDALGQVDAALFQVSDQPLLTRKTVAALVEFYRRQPDKLAALSHHGIRGNPCIFPKAYFPELRALTEDCGGSSVIRHHEGEVFLLETDPMELADADTTGDLKIISSV